jgi:hypothetical protein
MDPHLNTGHGEASELAISARGFGNVDSRLLTVVYTMRNKTAWLITDPDARPTTEEMLEAAAVAGRVRLVRERLNLSQATCGHNPLSHASALTINLPADYQSTN